MAPLTLILLLLAACSEGPAFSCCGTDGGKPTYRTMPADITVTDGQREVVRQAMNDNVIPSTLDVDEVARSAALHARSQAFWRGLTENLDEYSQVMRLAESAGRDSMLAAYPLLLSGYVSDLQARDCARGPWQLALDDERVQIGPCRIRDSLEPWTRGDDAPVDESGCRVIRCDPDDREDLAKSTRAVLAAGTPLPAAGDRAVAAGIHLLAVCAPTSEARPAHCARVQVPGGS